MQHALTALLAPLALACSPVAASDALMGKWGAGDTAHEAIYGHIDIGRERIRFSRDGKVWRCSTKYKMVPPGNAPLYQSESASEPQWTNPEAVEYVKLKLGPSACTQSLYFLFGIPRANPEFASFAELGPNSSLQGLGHFIKWRER